VSHLQLRPRRSSVTNAGTMTAPGTGPRLDAPDLDSAVDALRAGGLRVSAARRLVLEALYGADGPVTAEQVADGLAGRLPRSDLASVYRNLETLEEIGLASCGAVKAVDPDEMEPVRSEIRQRFGYEADFSHFPVLGSCPDCEGS
jgi:Fur family transcriptional regulator, ferric uptake regulator